MSERINEPPEERLIGAVPDESGHFGPYGGQFISETLAGPVEALRAAYEEAKGEDRKSVV